MKPAPQSQAFCPYFHEAVELIGSRWTGAIIRAMLSGISHFTELKAVVPGLSDRMLSERLKELEAEGIVVRQVTPSTPVRVEYGLTEKGRALAEPIGSISAWANDWLVDQVPAPARKTVTEARRPRGRGRSIRVGS